MGSTLVTISGWKDKEDMVYKLNGILVIKTKEILPICDNPGWILKELLWMAKPDKDKYLIILPIYESKPEIIETEHKLWLPCG